jgi:hypothetical protein
MVIMAERQVLAPGHGFVQSALRVRLVKQAVLG